MILKNAKKMGLLILMASNAFAQAGNGAGNGGGEDGLFKNIRDEVKVWMDKNIAINALDAKLGLKEINSDSVYRQYVQATEVVGEKVVFNHDVIRYGNNIRICKNENATITCNIDEWAKTSGNVRYMIVLHEYLGVAGIETNVATDYSSYAISPKILGFVQSKESFELGMENTGGSLVVVSQIENRSTGQKLIYSRLGNQALFTLEEQGQSKLLKTIEVKTSASEISLSMNGNRSYRFKIMSKMAEATSSAYHWCWIGNSDGKYTPQNPQEAIYQDWLFRPGTLLVIGTPVTAPLCGVLPAAPVIAGAALLPLDLLINLFGKDAIAHRKFKSMMRGESSEISNRAFNSLIDQLTAL